MQLVIGKAFIKLNKEKELYMQTKAFLEPMIINDDVDGLIFVGRCWVRNGEG